MKQQVQRKSIISLLPIFGMIVLLLLSPCKVRNFIEASIEAPLTQVTNLNQTTLSSTNCISAEEIAVNDATVTKSSKQVLPVFTAKTLKIEDDNIYSATTLNLGYEKLLDLTSTVPLYILYRNFKGYL